MFRALARQKNEMRNKIILLSIGILLMGVLLGSCKKISGYKTGDGPTLTIDTTWLSNQNRYISVKIESYDFEEDVRWVGLCVSKEYQVPDLSNSQPVFLENYFKSELNYTFVGEPGEIFYLRPFVIIQKDVYYGETISLYSYGKWKHLNYTATYSGFKPKVDIISKNDIRIVCAKNQFQSTDQGETWALVEDNLPNEKTLFVHFFNPDQAVLVTDNPDHPYYKSNNGGITWFEAPFLVSSGTIDAACFYSLTKGFVVSQRKNIRTTNDGGTAWSTFSLSILDADIITEFYALNEDVTFLTTAYGNIFRTLDGGVSWEYMNPDFNLSAVTDLYFFDENHGFICEDGTIMETWNGGVTYNLIFSNDKCPLWKLTFVDDKRGFARGPHEASAITLDRGVNWIVLTNANGSYPYGEYVDFEMYSSDFGIAVNQNKDDAFRFGE